MEGLMRIQSSLGFLILLSCAPTIENRAPDRSQPSPSLDSASAPIGEGIEDLTATIHDEIGSILDVTWTQNHSSEVQVRYSFDDDVWLETPSTGGEEGSQSMLLLGIPYGSEVSYQLIWEQDGSQVESETQTAENGSLPSNIPEAVEFDSEDALIDPESPYIFTSMNAAGTNEAYVIFIVDRQGRVVWAMDIPRFRLSLHSRLSHDGTELLVDLNSYWYLYDGGAASQIQRMKIDGSVVELIDTPGLHHPFTDLPDGTLAYAYNQATVTGDWSYETLVRVLPDGEIEEFFDCKAYFDSIGETSDCGSNTLYWDDERETFLYSLYSVDSMLEIDPESGEVLHTYGQLAGAWDFSPEDSAFYWQHGGHITSEGTLLLSCHPEGDSDVLQIREYERDEDTQTLHQVWHFGEDSWATGATMGEAHRLSNGNTLHNYGSGTQIREVSPEGRVVWDIQWQASLLGRSTPIEDLYALMP
jgi:hypothetical protein